MQIRSPYYSRTVLSISEVDHVSPGDDETANLICCSDL